MIQIVSVQDGESLDDFIQLSHEYVTWMIAEIPKHFPALNLAQFAAEHKYDDIRKKYPGEHVPPDGCMLIASYQGQVAGCIALGRLSETICELRTLFVRPQFRGLGIAKILIESTLQQARDFDYHCARLDTLGFMQGALNLYEGMGFVHIEAYYEASDELRQYMHFLELNLSKD